MDAGSGPPPSLLETDSAVAAQQEPARAEPTLRQAYRIAAIGDSLTDEHSHGGRFLRVLRRHCPETRIDNYGKGGDMVNQMRRRFDRQIVSLPAGTYTHLVVFGGVNDLYSDLSAGRTVAKITADLSHMYEVARSLGMRVVAVTVAPWGGFKRYYNERRAQSTLELNRWIVEQSQTGRIDTVVDAYALLSCGDPERLCDEYSRPFKDGLHFGPEGHERLGASLLEAAFTHCR
jgi:lysophospholipase L1-like esterase